MPEQDMPTPVIVSSLESAPSCCGPEYCACVCSFSAVVAPVTNYIMEVLPEGTRDTKPMELAYEDLEKLSGEEVMRICEWLTDKVSPP